MQGALSETQLRFIFNCNDSQYEFSNSARFRLMLPHLYRAVRARSQLLEREIFGCSDQDGSCWPHLHCWRHGQRCEEFQTFLQIFRGVLHLNADADNLVGRSTGARPLRVNLLQGVKDGQAILVGDATEDRMTPIEMRSRNEGDEKLRSVGIGSGVGHA